VGERRIGVHFDGIGDWNQDVQYAFLVSRTCDRLSEIFRQADPSTIPEHAVSVLLLVNRFEQLDGVDVVVLGLDRGNITAEELERVLRCLKSRSASSMGF